MKNRIARASLALGLLALLPLGGCAPADGDDLAELAQPASLPEGDRVAEGALRPPTDLPDAGALVLERVGAGDFDVDAFRAAITAAAGRTAASAASIASGKEVSAETAEALVAAAVARAARVGRDEVVAAARPACGGAGEDECPKRFVAVVSQHDNDFAQAIAQIVGPMHGAVPGLRVTVWKVSRGGVEEPGAITLHGRSGGRLVGVVYYL